MTLSPIEQAQAHFRDKNFVSLTGVIEESLLAVAHRYAVMKSQSGEMSLDDPMTPDTPSAYCDTLMEALLELCVPMVEAATRLKLFPTYSYFRVYKYGDVLDPHTDRPACEISVTLTLGYQASEPWKIWFKQGDLVTNVESRPGDAVVYRGMDIIHWRQAFEGEYHAQAFLHYVDQNGSHADNRFDKLPMLGLRSRKSNQ